jgi:cyclic lactone autoinducer peptide
LRRYFILTTKKCRIYAAFGVSQTPRQILVERREVIMKKEVTKSVAKGMKAALDVVLRTEANTASCLIMYQPKAPKELMNYRRNK